MGDPKPEFIPVTLDVGALQEFRRPFTPEAVRWKIQSAWKSGKGAVVVAYIDARLVIERLNHVTALWQDEYVVVAPNTLRCDLTVCGITRSDVGVGQGSDDGMRMKGAYSDALKRAGVKFGIGVSIYAMKAPSLRVGSGDGELRTYRKGNGEEAPTLDDRSEAFLREQYRRWLKARGEEAFGPALDHGDQAGAAGDPDVAGTDIVSEGPSGPSEGTERPAPTSAVYAAQRDAQDAYARIDPSHPEFPSRAEFQRLAREATARSSEEDIGPLVELTARLERLG